MMPKLIDSDSNVRDALNEELKLSVVIPNHNYADYVGIAIESALRVNWPNVEVVVVDDGSTDSSRDVISKFSQDVIVINQENMGQMPSCVNGFRKSSGNVVIFLDSDDVLHPDVMTEISRVWSDNACKFQFQMRVVDAQGNPTGNILPQYFSHPSPTQIRDWAVTTGAYPTPPGSGNAYPRWFVERVFNFKSDFVDRAPDSYLIAAAPAHGDVITIPKTLVDYRVHGANHGAHLRLDDSRFSREVDLALRRHKFFTEVASSEGVHVATDAMKKNLTFLCLRTASYVLRPEIHPITNENSARILTDSFKSLFYPQGFSVSQRSFLFLWILGVLSSPRHFGRSIVSWRYAPTERPKWIKSTLQLLRAVR